MPITNLSVPYPDFKLHEVIDPEQFDFNNGAVVDKVNAILVVLNQITDAVAVGASGADKISLTAIAPFTSTKLQAFLNEVITRLQATTSGSSGAGFIGTPTITGVTGTTVSAQLASLKALLDTEKTRITALEGRATTVEGRATTLESRATTLEGRATTLEGTTATNTSNISSVTTRVTNVETGKADKSTTYTKADIDSKVFPSANIADGSIVNAKIGNQAVTADKVHPSILENVSVSTHRNTSILDHPDLSVTTAKIATSAITTTKLATEAVTFDKLGTDAITYIDNAGTKVATGISITDTGNYYTGINVETALQEVGQVLNSMRGDLITSTNAVLGG